MGDGSPRARRRALGVLLLVAGFAGLFYLTKWEAASRMAREPAPAVAPAAEAELPAEAPAPKAAAEPAAPAFDLVRVEPDGSAAVAGTAEPGATVTIYADDAPLADAQADAEGNFVAIFKVEPSAEPRALTLDATMPGGVASRSGDVVMLLPKAPAAPEPEPEPEPAPGPGAAPAAPEPEPAPGPGAAPDEVAAASSAPQAPAAEAPEVAATAIVRDDTIEVQPPPGDPDAVRRVTLASVSYAEGGEVTLAGVGTAGAVVRAYVDDRFTGEVRVAEDGRWKMDLDDVAEGIYRLRIDQLARDGKVASRVETPFQRDYPRAPPPRPGSAVAPGPGTISVTVQPGNNLWTLALARYGSGVMYSQIFTANRDQIRDPDLIYPGQIFSLPDPDTVE